MNEKPLDELDKLLESFGDIVVEDIDNAICNDEGVEAWLQSGGEITFVIVKDETTMTYKKEEK